MVIGIDEVGRGCWAGPLVAAAVGFTNNFSVAGLDDSKKLTAKKRVVLTREIQAVTEKISIGWVWPREINELGLTESVRLAMKRAIEQIEVSKADEIIIDGNIDYLELPNSIAVVKADGTVPAVSAASIVAKVARDEYMRQISEKYPEYGFEKHIGYGTKVHIEALRLYGVLPIHRINYKPVKAIMAAAR